MNYEKNKSRQLRKQQMAAVAAKKAEQLASDPYQPGAVWPRHRVLFEGEFRPVIKTVKVVVTEAEVKAAIGDWRCTARRRKQIAEVH